MALTQVRARLGGTWTTLTYNAATGRYEGSLVPSGTSIHQPGGYFSVEVEAANQTGASASVSGAVLPSLRLVVRETAAPSLVLLAPQPGYVTVKRPVITAEASDEAGGSGLDPDSFLVSLDGAPQTAGKAVSAIAGGYRLSYTPAADLSEGGHTVTLSVADRDGNRTTISAAYTVDTVPPVLGLTAPDSRRVVDVPALEVGGTVFEETSGPAAAAVRVNGLLVEGVSVENGSFAALVPLTVGANDIVITAADGAGLRSELTLSVIRLVTDRTDADVLRVQDLCARGYAAWTAEERAWWASAPCLRGSYDERDMNRVEAAMAHIAAWLLAYGYLAGYAPPGRGPWTAEEAPRAGDAERYLRNVEALRSVLPLQEGTPETPEGMDGFTFGRANDIEKILVAVDAVRPVLDRSAWFYAGEIYAGEF